MRVGRIGYINCFPVYGAIDRGIVPLGAELVTGTPAELNGLLSAGALDVSVISAVEYAREADRFVLLPDLAVSCDGPVQSVALFSRRPVAELDGATILTSEASRTSVFLLRLLAADVWGIAPCLVSARTEASDLAALDQLPHEAVLVIGDGALVLAGEERYPYRYDLGAAWKDWTGLPFVFAVWAARREVAPEPVQDVLDALHRSREWGLAHLEDLAQEASDRTGLSAALCARYLGGLDYRMTERHVEGLTSFFRRLAQHGMAREGSLRFLSVA
jgi:chorismate dehydratase